MKKFGRWSLAVVPILVAFWATMAFRLGISKPRASAPILLQESQGQASSDVSTAISAEQKQAAMTKALAALETVAANKRERAANSTPEDVERRAKLLERLKQDHYTRFFENTDLDKATKTKALDVLSERNARLREIDQQMLEGKLSGLEAGRASLQCKKDYEDQLSQVVGPQLAVEFSFWDKAKNRSPGKPRPAAEE